LRGICEDIIEDCIAYDLIAQPSSPTPNPFSANSTFDLVWLILRFNLGYQPSSLAAQLAAQALITIFPVARISIPN